MSYVHNNNEKNYVATYKELIVTFVIFCVILIVLYPKEIIKEQILSEKSNYDLSMLYLRNLLDHDPENEQLMLILAEQSLRTGKIDLSLRLLDLLHKSKNPDYRNKSNKLSYELIKDRYFYISDESILVKERKKLKKFFYSIFKDKKFKEENYDMWYREAMFNSHDVATYYFVKKLLIKEPLDIDYLQSAYYMANKFNDSEEAVGYLDLLMKYDPNQKEKWLADRYYVLMNDKEYKEAELFLEDKSKDSLKWKIELAEFYLMRKKYVSASNVYMSLFDESSDYKVKKNYFYKATGALQAGSHLKRAASLGNKYENYYINDLGVRKFLLKMYIATGNLEYASDLSMKILRKEKR